MAIMDLEQELNPPEVEEVVFKWLESELQTNHVSGSLLLPIQIAFRKQDAPNVFGILW
jgi:hypothetical protein